MITGLAAGGAEQQLRLLLRHLPEERVRCEVAVLTNPGMLAELIAADGVPVADVGMRGNRDFAATRRLTRMIGAGGRDGAYDLVHVHLYRAMLHGRLAARLAGVPHLLATEHSLHPERIEGRRVNAAIRGLYVAGERLGEMTVAVSDAVAEALAGWRVPASRVRVLPNALDTAAFAHRPERRAELRGRLSIPGDRPVIAAVGRLEADKEWPVLLRAVAAMADTEPLLAVVGEGSRRAELTALAERLGIARRVVFTGESGEVASWLDAADALASPSPRETFNLAVVEGLAAGLPVAWRCAPALARARLDAGMARQVGTDEAGAWREALEGLLTAHPPTGVRASVPVGVLERFSPERLGASMASLYEELAGRPGLRRIAAGRAVRRRAAGRPYSLAPTRRSRTSSKSPAPLTGRAAPRLEPGVRGGEGDRLPDGSGPDTHPHSLTEGHHG
ncbi:hypothetical protein BIV57_18630 [Mangrovactinospora gilvigrisea]|uniref:Glycosyl transferase n=1 Tax=Mangrovactinospora gilvigrisea TaxID=1428644 RepID=A0A1J7BRB9_9ACTN|nr:hypothetical protein BIV57_18630 [Mangrovactinospora gilvigrisea]